MDVMRKILIPLSGRYAPDDPEDLDIPALQAGFDAARRFDAHVEVICVTEEPTRPKEGWAAWVPDYGLGDQIERIKQEGEARRRRAEAAYEKVRAGSDPLPASLTAPGPGFSSSFVEQVGDIRETVGMNGRVSDLIVIASSEARWAMPFRPILEASLRRTACPVLVSPPTPSATFATNIAIAWNDSVESAHAVSASLSLLKAAQKVIVVSCNEGDSTPPRSEALVEFLAWHGIAATAIEISETVRRVGPAIVDVALDEGCDLLVLGAYIHMRGYNLLFGSLTELVLKDPKMPALLVP